jgi:hypothetical protein
LVLVNIKFMDWCRSSFRRAVRRRGSGDPAGGKNAARGSSETGSQSMQAFGGLAATMVIEPAVAPALPSVTTTSLIWMRRCPRMTKKPMRSCSTPKPR